MDKKNKLTEFFQDVAPLDMPVQELTARYENQCAQNQHRMRGMPSNFPTHGTEFIIEMRLREWAERRLKELDDSRKTPPAGNKIPPPPRKP